MNINIEKSPPTLQEIEEARKKQILKLKITAVIFCVSIAIFIFGTGTILGGMNIRIVLTLLYSFIGMMMLAIFYNGYLNFYVPISPDQCEMAAELKEIPLVGHYIDQVAAQKRELVGVEFYALSEASEDIREKMRVESKKAALYGT